MNNDKKNNNNQNIKIKCLKCLEEKNIEEFNKQNRPSNAKRFFRKNICKTCDSIANKERYKKKWPEIIQRADEWNKKYRARGSITPPEA